ncbi:ExbD/TolR family protein [Pararhodobacter oceanensis]|uniref:ExbD/TolR family protein n=1 Tax=Pararhodobacter oceanensis TaxID=2172121 RepID=UPI003A92B5F9
MIRLSRPRPAKRPGLVAMIDVIFLLIVFFMVAARLDQQEALPLSIAGAGAGGVWEGPPRLVEIGAQAVWLNGVSISLAELPEALAALMPDEAAPVIALPRAEATVADLARVIGELRGEGIERVILAPGGGP